MCLALGADTDWPSALINLPTELHQMRPLQFEIVTAGSPNRAWKSFMQRYHYLGYKPLAGAQMRYLVRSPNTEPLALLSFGAAAWKIVPRTRSLVGAARPISTICRWW